jgi:hypothetical protein
MSFGDPNVPVGGNILAHAVTHRILMKKAGTLHIGLGLLDFSPSPCIDQICLPIA